MKKKAITAIILAILVSLMMPMVAWADIKETVDDSYLISHSMVINDNIAVRDMSAISVEKMSVEVNGDVKKDLGLQDLVVVYGKNVHVSISGKAENNDGYVINVTGEGSTVTVGGDIKSDKQRAIVAENGSTVTVNGDVSADTGIYAKNSEVNVKGKLTSFDDIVYHGGVYAENAVVTADSIDAKTIGITATGANTNVKITNGVKSTIQSLGGEDVNAIKASGGAHVDAGAAESLAPAVDATGAGTMVIVRNIAKVTGSGKTAVNASDGARVEVKDIISTSGNGANASSGIITAGSVVSNGNALTTSSHGTITVTGDAVSTGSTVFNAAAESEIIVEGTAKGATGTFSGDSSADSTIIVYAIDLADGEKDTDDAKVNALFENVDYIIKNVSERGGFTLSSATAGAIGVYTDSKGIKHQTAKETGSGPSNIIINVSEVEGYTFKSFSGDSSALVFYDVKKGSYTLMVPRGGGISLNLVYEAIVGPTPNPKPKNQSSSGTSSWSSVLGSSDTPVSDGSWKIADGAFTYTINGYTVTNAKVWIKYTAADGNTYAGCFYFGADGKMKTGWQTIGGKQYYFNEAPGATYGMMIVNTTTPDGQTVGADGAKSK